MKIPNLRLNKTVSDKWLEGCDKSIHHFLAKVRMFHKLETHYESKGFGIEDGLMTIDFIPANGISIKKKYAKLIYEIARKFEVTLIWKEMMFPGTIDPVIGLRIYGFRTHVIEVRSILNYLINGLDLYFNVHVELLRKKRKARRAQGKTLLYGETDARERTNKNIANKLITLENLLRQYKPYEYPNSQAIREFIYKQVTQDNKLNHKKYGKMTEPTIKSVTARKGFIQLNRII